MEGLEKVRGTVLVTGNAGYIGTVMTGFLKTSSYRVIGLDNGWFQRRELFPAPPELLPAKQITKDIRYVTEADLAGIDSVIHLAGLSNDPVGEINPQATEDINYKATIRLARLCKNKGITRFILASSCSIYGIAEEGKAVNESGRLNPITAYAKAKVESEHSLAELADEDFHPVFMRNATVYGLSPRLRLDLVVNNLTAWAYLTGEITIMSDGTPWRPIIHVEDVCRAFIVALESPTENIHCQAFNTGSDEENYRVIDIAERIHRLLPNTKVKILNTAGSDERTYRVDFSKIGNMLPAFMHKRSLEDGIIELIGAYRRYGLTMEDFESDRFFRIRAVKSLIASGEIDRDLLLTDALQSRQEEML